MLTKNLSEDIRLLAIQNLKGGEKEKVIWMVSNMKKNKAFLYKNNSSKDKSFENLLKEFQDRYINYRKNWSYQPKKIINEKLIGEKLKTFIFR